MLKTRRQRSFWARIKLSIILFQTPRRASDFNNLKQVPFLIFRNVDLREKRKTHAKSNTLLRFSLLPFLCSTLIFLTKDFCSLAFSSFPSLYFQRPLRSKLLIFVAASEKYYIRISFFLSSLFFIFFRFFFFINFEKEVNLMPKAISIKPFYFRAEAHLWCHTFYKQRSALSCSVPQNNGADYTLPSYSLSSPYPHFFLKSFKKKSAPAA